MSSHGVTDHVGVYANYAGVGVSEGTTGSRASGFCVYGEKICSVGSKYVSVTETLHEAIMFWCFHDNFLLIMRRHC